MRYTKASWVVGDGCDATRGVSRGARIRDCTMMGRGETLADAVRAQRSTEVQEDGSGWLRRCRGEPRDARVNKQDN